MAKPKKVTEYDDDDEISKSISEFQAQQKIEKSKEEAPPKEEEEEEGFGITAKNGSVVKDNVVTNTPEKGEIIFGGDIGVDVGEPEGDKTIMLCSCCDKEWTTKNARLSRPACSCPMYATCKECGYCKAHCRCSVPRTLS